MGERQHLHRSDYPDTLAVLQAPLLGSRIDTSDLGYEPTEEGAWVDWRQLIEGKLSSTEVAAVHITRGIAIAERAGGVPPTAAASVRTAITGGTGG